MLHQALIRALGFLEVVGTDEAVKKIA